MRPIEERVRLGRPELRSCRRSLARACLGMTVGQPRIKAHQANHKRPGLKLHRWPPPGPKLVRALAAATVHLVKTRPTPRGRRTSFRPRGHTQTQACTSGVCHANACATTTAAHPRRSLSPPSATCYTALPAPADTLKGSASRRALRPRTTHKGRRSLEHSLRPRTAHTPVARMAEG